MSAEYEPQAQLEALGLHIDQQAVALRSLLVARQLLLSQPGVDEAAMAPNDTRLAGIAAMIGDTIGLQLHAGGSDPASVTEAVPAGVQPLSVAPARTAASRDRGNILRLPTGEVTAEPIAVELMSERTAKINGMEIPLTYHQKAILHALEIANGDMITPEDIRLIALATVPGFQGAARDMLLSVGDLAKEIEKKLGYGVIAVSEEEGSKGSIYRFGLANALGSTYVTDIEPPIPGPDTPRLIATGIVEGSLFGGFMRVENAQPAMSDTSIVIEVLADNLLYVRDGNTGRAVPIRGNNMFAANALLAIGGMANKADVKNLALQTGDLGNVLIHKISAYVGFLHDLLGQSDGRDIVVRSGSGLDLTYGMSRELIVLERRGALTSQEVVSLPPTGAAPAASQPEADQPAESLGLMSRKYRDVVEQYEKMDDADAQPQDELEARLAEGSDIEVSVVRDMLVLHRLGVALGVSFVPDELEDVAEFTACKEAAYARIDKALQSAEFMNRKVRLDELNVLAFRLGLSPEIPYLGALEVALPNRNATYAYALGQVRQSGLSADRLHRILQVNVEPLELTFERALDKLRLQFTSSK